MHVKNLLINQLTKTSTILGKENNMKRFYTSIMALAIAFFGLMANAQYKVEINSAPHDNWVSGGQNFDPVELAAALGTDTASLHQAIVTENIVYRLDGEVKSNTYTGNHNEWWMALDGTPQGYGDEGTSWFVGLSYDEAALDETLENDVISVWGVLLIHKFECKPFRKSRSFGISRPS